MAPLQERQDWLGTCGSASLRYLPSSLEHRKTLTPYKPFLQTSRDSHLEHMAQKIALAETAVTVLRKSRVIRNTVGQIKTAEPAISEVQMDLLAEPPLGADAKAIAHQQHPNEQFRINRRAASMAVEIRKMSSDAAQIDKPIYRPQQVILWDMTLQRELIKQRRLRFLLRSHHR